MNWKEKAILRRNMNKALIKRVKELTESRDKCKNKLIERQRKIDELHLNNKALKTELRKIKECEMNCPGSHSHSLEMIQTIVYLKLNSSVSFRALEKITKILDGRIGSAKETAVRATILNWVLKIGLYELTRQKEKSDDWIIILDHSIQLGDKKLFVILGIKESEIDFSRPLNYEDLTPLAITSKKKWTGNAVRDIIIELEQDIGRIIYAAGDYGGDIKKGLRQSSITHIHDVTHAIAIIVKKIYSADEDYIAFTKKMSSMRIKLGQTGIAHIIPPAQRTKSRYQNIKKISDWGVKSLCYIDCISAGNRKNDKETKQIKKELKWVLEYRGFINDLAQINNIIIKIELSVKNNGLTSVTEKECNNYLNELTSEKGVIFKQEMQEWFRKSGKLLSAGKKIICTSDILESAFGKYKNYVSSNNMAGITSLVLCIAAFTSSLSEDEIKDALEKITINDIKKWARENIGESLLKKRKNILLSNR